VPLFTEFPTSPILGNPYPYTRIPMQLYYKPVVTQCNRWFGVGGYGRSRREGVLRFGGENRRGG
jgi:hypothetical protein